MTHINTRYTPVRFPVLGSQSLITRSGDPEAMIRPKGSQASAYTDDFGEPMSGGISETIGRAMAFSVGTEGDVVGEHAMERSQSLMVRSNEPEATQLCSRLRETARLRLDT